MSTIDATNQEEPNMKTIAHAIRRAFQRQSPRVVSIVGDKALMSDWTMRPIQDASPRRDDMPVIHTGHRGR